MNAKTATLNIKLNHLEKQRNDFIIIEKKKYELKEDLSIELDFNEFESELCLKVVNLELVRKRKKVLYYFEVIPGINNAILFKNFGKTRDLIFNENKKTKIEIEKDEESLDEIDISKTKRIILINISQDNLFFVNGVDLTDDIIDLSTNNSIQISVLNLEKKIFPYKIISSKCDTFLEKIGKYEKDSYEFVNEIQQIIGKTKNLSKEEKKKINTNLKKKNYLLDALEVKFNFSKKIMLAYFNKKTYLDFISNCCLFKIIQEYLSREEVFLSELKAIFDFFNKYKLNLEKDINLNIYQKILVLIEFTNFFIEKDENITKFETIKFSYYSKNTMEIDSPLLSAINFLKEFIEDLDETSPFFIPLILIDSGKFIYNNESLYAYGLNSKEIVKKHLRDIVYETIVVYEDYDSDKIAETNKNTGVVSLNLCKTLAPKEIINIGKKIEDKSVMIDYSLPIILTLFHELLGHKKFSYNSNSNASDSPGGYYDEKKNKIIRFANVKSNIESEDIIKIIRDQDCEGDSGHFLEYFFGECKYGYIIHLIEKMILGKVNLNFLYNKRLWKEEIDILRKYIELKYLIYHEKKEFLKETINFKDITEEISYLEKLIISNNIQFTFLGKKESSPFSYEGLITRKKRKYLMDVKKSENYEEEIDYEYYSKKPIEELKKILKDENLPYDVYIKLYKIYSKKFRKQ